MNFTTQPVPGVMLRLVGCSEKGKCLILLSEKKDTMLHVQDVSREACLSTFEVFLPTHFWPKVLYVLVSLQCKMTK